MKWIDTTAMVFAMGIFATACSAPVGPAAPSGTTAPAVTTALSATPAPNTRGNLAIASMAVSDGGQNAQGAWQYKVNVRLRETGGVDMTVINIQVEAVLGSRILALTNIVPVMFVRANSSGDTAFVFTADTHVDNLTALTVGLNVHFRDANGIPGSVSEAFSGFGAWDY